MPPAKRATAPKTARARQAAAPGREQLPSGRPEPLIRLKRTAAAPAAPERVLLFVKEYDDGRPEQEFWAAKQQMASISLRFMHMTRHEGDNAATAWALEQVLGLEAYEDLMNDAQLTDEELAEIFTLVTNAIMGAGQDPKGPRR